MKKQILTGLLMLPLVVSANQALTISGDLEKSLLTDLVSPDFNNDTVNWSIHLTSGSDVVAKANIVGDDYGQLLIDCKKKSSKFTYLGKFTTFAAKSLSEKNTDALIAKFCE